MTDLLLEATKVLREATNGEAPHGRDARARVLAAVRAQSRRRIIRLTFGLPIAAVLIGSGAWATSGQGLSGIVQHVSAVLRRGPTESRHSPQRPHAKQRESTPAASVPITVPAPSASAVIEEVKVEDVKVEDVKAPSTPAIGLANTDRRAPPQDTPLTERELALYEAAHRAHFVQKDYATSLTAWSAYLREAPRGRFAIEARYNRALCLVRLGRNDEAKRALEAFARGSFGNYRKADAAALLEELGR